MIFHPKLSLFSNYSIGRLIRLLPPGEVWLRLPKSAPHSWRTATRLRRGCCQDWSRTWLQIVQSLLRPLSKKTKQKVKSYGQDKLSHFMHICQESQTVRKFYSPRRPFCLHRAEEPWLLHHENSCFLSPQDGKPCAVLACTRHSVWLLEAFLEASYVMDLNIPTV